MTMTTTMTTPQIFSDALLNPALACPEGLSVWNRSDPARRFNVYRNNVVASLIDALADTFPVTQELVGEEFFREMARLYLRSEPPAHPVLAHYGGTFAAYIQTFPPAAGVPYLSDVAALEWLYVQSFHAADAQPVGADVLTAALAQPEQLMSMKIRLHPSMRLLDAGSAAGSLWAVHQGTLDLQSVNPAAAETLFIARSGLQVDVLVIPKSAGHFFQALLLGAELGVAAEDTAMHFPDFDPAQALGLLLRQQVIIELLSENLL